MKTAPRVHGAVIFLLASWVLPFVFNIGPMRMTPYRLALIFLFVPCVVWLVQGRAGRVRLPDILLLGFAVWCMISLVVIHGTAGFQTAGIQILETLTPYILARCCIRNADDFLALARFLTGVMIVLLPFALFEALTGRNIYLEVAAQFWQVIDFTDKQPRWGLRRAQLFFDHPILTGVCCGAIFSLTHMVVGRDLSLARRWPKSAMTFLIAALSLSSGPISGLLVQLSLLLWNRALGWFQARWTFLISLIAILALSVELFAKRPLPNLLLGFSFEPDSAFFRLLIWTYGSASVYQHPLFGVGMGEWDRPVWMAPSIDMFWLYNAVVFGMPGGSLMLAFFAAVVLMVGRVPNLGSRANDYRTGYLISLVFFFVTGWMVHFWNGTYVFFIFIVGSGMWLLDAEPAKVSIQAQNNGPVSAPGKDRSATIRLREANRKSPRILPVRNSSKH